MGINVFVGVNTGDDSWPEVLGECSNSILYNMDSVSPAFVANFPWLLLTYTPRTFVSELRLVMIWVTGFLQVALSLFQWPSTYEPKASMLLSRSALLTSCVNEGVKSRLIEVKSAGAGRSGWALKPEPSWCPGFKAICDDYLSRILPAEISFRFPFWLIAWAINRWRLWRKRGSWHVPEWIWKFNVVWLSFVEVVLPSLAKLLW